jgi:hypothetical protein
MTLYDRMRTRGGWGWRAAFALSGSLALVLVAGIAYTIGVGIGVWGTNLPAAWAFAIVSFVFWIGIGHAGTFISAILYLTATPYAERLRVWQKPVREPRPAEVQDRKDRGLRQGQQRHRLGESR